jgi:hypothetical protein
MPAEDSAGHFVLAAASPPGFIGKAQSPSMKQEAREALIELLFLSLYLDNHLSLAEDDVLGRSLDSIGWEGTMPRETFIMRAFSTARGAVADGVAREGFVEHRATLIRDAGESATAYTWLRNILAADGISYNEQHFLKKLENLLFA